MADLVNQRLADRDDDVVLVVARVLDRALKERDLVGQRVAVRPLALGERRAFVEAEQRIGRLDADSPSCSFVGSSSTTMAMFCIASRKCVGNRLERFVDELAGTRRGSSRDPPGARLSAGAFAPSARK